jgi:hypothetical protein
MRKLSVDKVQEEHMSQSFIYGCEEGEIRWKRIIKDIVLCWRCYRESRVTACNWTREVEKQNTIGDGVKVGALSKVGYKEGWRSEIELGVS